MHTGDLFTIALAGIIAGAATHGAKIVGNEMGIHRYLYDTGDKFKEAAKKDKVMSKDTEISDLDRFGRRLK